MYLIRRIGRTVPCEGSSREEGVSLAYAHLPTQFSRIDLTHVCTIKYKDGCDEEMARTCADVDMDVAAPGSGDAVLFA